MKPIIFDTKSGVTYSGLFGQIPAKLVDTITYEELHSLSQQILGPQVLSGDKEALLHKMDQFRAGVGALRLRLLREVRRDRHHAYEVSGSLWGCFVASFGCSARPLKYYKLCGIASQGYGHLVTALANLPFQDELAARWGHNSWREYAGAVWQTKDRLMQEEREYRDAAITIRSNRHRHRRYVCWADWLGARSSGGRVP